MADALPIAGARHLESVALFCTTINARLYRVLQPLRVTPLQAAILVYLYNHQAEPARVTWLAEVFHLRMPTLSEAVSTLVRRGFLKKQRSKTDGRARDLVVTTKGVMAIRQGVERVRGLFMIRDIIENRVAS